MPDLMEKRRSGWVLLAVCALIASLLAVEVNPATAVEETADHLASTSACEGEAETDHMFTDVPAGHTFRDAINCIAYHGITVGTGDGTTFSPNDDVTRWQMALFIARAMKAAGVDLGAVVDAGFTDIGDAPAELRDAINQLTANGVIPEADTYRPNDPMTRADMTIFLVGFLDKAAPNVTITEDGVIMLGTGSAAAEADDHFADVRALSSPSVDRAAAALWELGVTRGTNKAAAVVDPTRTPLDVKYDPQSTVTRGAMAAFITRALAHTSLAPATTTVDPPEADPPGSSASGGSGGSGGSGRSPTTTTTAPPDPTTTTTAPPDPTTTTTVARTAVTVSFGALLYTATEGGAAANVRVELSAAAERTVTVPLTVTRSDGATTADYTLPAPPTQVTFDIGQRSQTFTVTAINDSIDDDGESLTIGFGTLPAGVTAAGHRSATVALADNDVPQVTVSFEKDSYTAREGSDAVTVTVKLSADPEREVMVPLSVTRGGGAIPADYEVSPTQVTFDVGQRSQTFTVTAINDSIDDDGESLTIGFGTLPAGVTAAGHRSATVALADNDVPQVTVSFEKDSYTAREGSDAVTVTVKLSADPEREVMVPLSVTRGGGAIPADYEVSPTQVTFDVGQRSQTFTVTAINDSIDDDGESLTIGFGTLPAGVTAAGHRSATVALADNDVPQVTVSFEKDSYTAREGSDAVTVTVKLSADPEREVMVPLSVTRGGGAIPADYEVSPTQVTFDVGQRSQTFTVTAVDDSVIDDGESITIGFGTLPAGVTAGGQREAKVSLVDNDHPPDITVSFGAPEYTATEGGAAATVRVELSAAAERTVTVPLTVTRSGGATTADYTLPAPPTQVTFDVGQRSQTFTVTAVDDSVIDNGESITIGFGTLPAGVTAGGQREAKVSLVDNDHPPDITVSFGAPEYTATEGGAAATVRVELSADPERTIKVNIIAVDHFRAVKGDYVLSTASVTFDAGQRSQTFTVTAVDDSGNDDGERITLGFGYENAITLPAGVTRGSQTTTQVSLVDNDDPPRGVRFGEHFYTATEGDDDATVIQVILSEARDETVVVPLRVSARNFGASDTDFMLSGLSDMSVTFEPNETTAEFSVTAVDDTGSDDGETIEFRFGNLPSSLTVRYPTFTVVWLKDNDDPPPGPFERDPSKDVYPLIPPGGTVRERTMEPRDLWSDGETLWLLSDKIVEYVFAYDLESSKRRSDSDIPIAANSCVGQYCNQIPWPWGLWSDGEILRVLDRTRRAIFAFDLDTGVPRPDLKIAGLELSGVKSAVGMWSDGEIVWVSDIYWDKIFAFELAGGSRSSDHDIDTLKSNGVQDPTSLWSDGVTMWVIDDVDDKLYAFDLATGERKSALDFTLLAAAGNHNLHGIWSDGVTMWVADRNDNRVYAYNMPVSSALKSLSATGVEFGLFQPGVVKYEATVPAGTTSTTVTAEAAFSSSTVSMSVSYVDADMDTVTGTTVPLTAGNNTITITSTNGDSTHTYTLTVTVPAS